MRPEETILEPEYAGVAHSSDFAVHAGGILGDAVALSPRAAYNGAMKQHGGDAGRAFSSASGPYGKQACHSILGVRCRLPD